MELCWDLESVITTGPSAWRVVERPQLTSASVLAPAIRPVMLRPSSTCLPDNVLVATLQVRMTRQYEKKLIFCPIWTKLYGDVPKLYRMCQCHQTKLNTAYWWACPSCLISAADSTSLQHGATLFKKKCSLKTLYKPAGLVTYCVYLYAYIHTHTVDGSVSHPYFKQNNKIILIK